MERLIERGHRLPDILNYTLAQLRAFTSAAARSQAMDDARWLTLLATGTRADARQLDAALERLKAHAHLDSH